MEFEVEERGERLEGRALGIDRQHLERLRRGEVPVDVTIDLHGLDRRAARPALRRTLREAFEQGGRCVLVVHGRGTRSDLGPVLKDSLVEWLVAPPIGRLVMAFATAQPRDGGGGATYVLLRRKRG